MTIRKMLCDVAFQLDRRITPERGISNAISPKRVVGY
jgi:hypothetical protein